MSARFGSFDGSSAVTAVEGIRVESAFLERSMLTYMTFEAGAIVPEHHHEHEQITLILDGEMEMQIGAETRTLRRGDWVAIPSNLPHAARVLRPTVAVDAWSPVRDDYK